MYKRINEDELKKMILDIQEEIEKKYSGTIFGNQIKQYERLVDKKNILRLISSLLE